MKGLIHIKTKILTLVILFCLQGCVTKISEIKSEIGDEEYIVFEAYTKGQNDLYLIDPEGKKEIQLTFDESTCELAPKWSPDGEEILFGLADLTFSNIWFSIIDFTKKASFKLKLIKSNKKLVMDAGPPLWYPQGRKIVFMVNEEGEEENDRKYGLYTMDIKGKNIKKISDFPNWTGIFSISPDGKNIAFEGGYGKKEGIYTLEIEGGRIERLTTHGYKPAYSSNGRSLAFQKKLKDDKFAKIYILDLKTKEIRRLNNDDSDRIEIDPCWSPDGRKIAFVGTRKQEFCDLFIVDVNGENLKRLTFTPKRIESNPSWRPRPVKER